MLQDNDLVQSALIIRIPSALLMVIFVLLTFKRRSSKLVGGYIKSEEFGER